MKTLDKSGTGLKLKNARKDAHMTVKKVSQRMGVSLETVYHWEVGRAIPSLASMVKLSYLYKTPIDALVERM
ncbi:MAG: helix-turn-helix transcriptional regulator [Blautia sp.]|nr:helix-turn-helix transcriptional regulator [Blautia sp.]